MAVLGSNWTTIASGSQNINGAVLTYYIEAKLDSQSTANNQSKVSTRARTSISGYMSTYYYSFTCSGCTEKADSAGTVIWNYANETVLTGSLTVTHADDGSKTLSMSGRCYGGGMGIDINLSGSIGLPAIARASKPTVSKNTVVLNGEDSLVVSTNRKSSGFTHTLRISMGDYAFNVTNVGESYTFKPTVSIWMPNMASWKQTVNVRCTTYNGSAQVGSAQSCSFTLQVDTSVYKPVISSVAVSDLNTVTAALEADGSFIKGYSMLSFDVSAEVSSGDYGYELSKGTVEYNGNTNEVSLSGQRVRFVEEMGEANGSQAVISLTDSKGYTVSLNRAISVIPYEKPVINRVTLTRVNAQGQPTETGSNIQYEIQVSAFSGSFGKVTNEIEVYTLTASAGTSAYTTRLEQTAATAGNGSVEVLNITGILTGTYASNSQFDIQFRLTDKLASAFSPVIRVHEGVPVFAWGVNHFDVYGELHTHDRTDTAQYLTFGISSTDEKTNARLAAFGYITSSGTTACIFIPMTKLPVAPAVSLLKVALRTSNGGYLGGSEYADLTSEISQVRVLKDQAMMEILCVRSSGFGITNNTPFAGLVDLSYSYSS